MSQVKCIRQANNFGFVKKHHLIDSGSFNKDLFLLEAPIASPKLVKLMETIRDLDEKDQKEHGTTFKHMIFTDVNSPAYGFKIIVSAFAAYDYQPCFVPKGTGFHLKDDQELLESTGNNFGLLASKPIYNRIFNSIYKKKFLLKFNQRDENIYGDLVRFIIVDQGFKEGIDLFDVKYVHLFEPLLPSDLKQAVGRSTRFCGQSGLKFMPSLGWPLHVFQYDNDISKISKALLGKQYKSSEEYWLEALDLDATKINFSNALNDATIDAAVDKDLTEAIHLFSVDGKQKGGRGKVGSVGKVGKSALASIPAPPARQFVSKVAMHEYINKHFGEYRYPKAKLENKCIVPSRVELKKGDVDVDVDVSRIITFTPTQDFVRHYFTPESPYKGILFYHSVGTGKLCSGIATATSTFDKLGYTILWVTRHTLKADFWKNMIGQICNISTREKIAAGLMKLPGANTAKHTLKSNNWIEPISYKQFTNMLLRDNKYYDMLVERNGEDDPLHKTLVIVDECHKLYSENVQASESPDMDIFEEWIQNSYARSGRDSVRVVLMSGTPYTDDSMELVKLLNLLKEGDEQFPTTFDDFASQFLNSQGNFTATGLKNFQNAIAGYVSYLNRSKDARSFSYPVFHHVNVPLLEYVKGDKGQNDLEIKNLKASLKESKAQNRQEVADLKLEQKEKLGKAKEVASAFKASVKSAKEAKRLETKQCMELPAKQRPECKEKAIVKLNATLAKIEAQAGAINTAELRKHFKDQIDGVKTMVKGSDVFLKLANLTTLMNDFKQQLKDIRPIIKENALKVKDARQVYKTLALELKDELSGVDKEEKEVRKEIRARLNPGIKEAKKELDDLKINVYNMKQDVYAIKLKMKRIPIADYSQMTRFVKKCNNY